MTSGEPEVFASIQGEGASVGVPSVFVRLSECNLKCTWCFVPETPVLMHDWTWRPIGELEPGARVIGIERPDERGKHVRLAAGVVTRTALRCAETVRVNDTLRCTPDHKFWLTGRDQTGRAGAAHSGWREVARAVGLNALFTTDPVRHEESAYRRGWLAGMADGDGCFWTLKHRRGYRRFRLALNDQALLDRAEQFAKSAGHELRRGAHSTTGFTDVPRQMNALWMTRDEDAKQFEAWLATDEDESSWNAGYLGGIIDAEGSHSAGALRIAQYEVNSRTRCRIETVLKRLDLSYTPSEHGFYVHHKGGQVWRALSIARPAKASIANGAFGHHPRASRGIQSVRSTGKLEEVVTLSTSLGSFVAGGFVVKNCDTKYTWDWSSYDKTKETSEVSSDAVYERIVSLAAATTRNVVITGGEPLLQQEALVGLVQKLRDAGFSVEVETNGTVEPIPDLAVLVTQWNVSPKLANSGNKVTARLRSGPLLWFAANKDAYFKFVVTAREDLEEVQAIATQYRIPPDRILVMPEGTDAITLTEHSSWLVGEAQRRGFRFSTRLHVLLWGSERGR